MKAVKKISTSLIIFYTLFNSMSCIVLANEALKAKEKTTNKNLLSNIDPIEKIDASKVFQVKIKKKEEVTLEELEKIIADNSDELKIINNQIEEKKYLLKREISSWYPSLNLSSSGLPQYMTGNTYNELSTNTSNNQIKSSLSATLKWDLINPTRIPQIEIAKENLDKARIAYEIKYRDLILEAHERFFLLQKSIQEVRIAKDSIKSSKIELQESKIRFNSGIGSKFDLLEAETKLSKDNKYLLEKIGIRKINESKLASILNLDENLTPKIITKPRILGQWESSLESSIIAALQYRKELEELMINLKINNNQAKISLAKNRPTLSIYNTIDGYLSQGEIGMPSPRNDNNINSFNNTIGIQFQWPILDGGFSKSNYLANKEKTKEIKTNIELKKDQIRYEIEEIFIRMNTAKNNIKYSLQEIKTSKESLRLSILRLKAGISTQLEVINNQKDLTQAEVDYFTLITDYNINLIKLQRKTGINKIKNCYFQNADNENFDTHDLNKKNSPQSLSLANETCMELI